MHFQSLLSSDQIVDSASLKKKLSKAPKLRGCDYCPRNSVKGITKIKGEVKGKQIFVWAQSPGPTENEQGVELIGRAGKWFWAEMAKVGFERKDCDIQNIVRCFPADYSKVRKKFVMRDPTKEELYCCSIYTDQAIVKSKARIHLVLGRFAADQLFGKKGKLKQKLRVFWNDKLNGKVFLLDHPAYFIRGTATEEKLKQFRRALVEAKKSLSDPPGKYGFLMKQDYKGITTYEAAVREAKRIKRKARRRRVVMDLEEGVLGGKKIPLCVGFSYKPGRSRVFLLEHMRGLEVSNAERKKIRSVVTGLLEDKSIRFSMHHGSYDKPAVRRFKLASNINYDYDTKYAEYFVYPGRRSYKLGEIAEVRFPDFSRHKEIIMPDAAPEGMNYEQANKEGKLNLAHIKWETMVLYNGADCDLEKRIEVSTKDKVSLPLLKSYMDAQFTLERMEPNGPLFDYNQYSVLEKIYPPRLKRLANKLRLLAGDTSFNPNAPAQVADVMYDKLELPILDKDGKRTTNKTTLELLSGKHQFPKLVLEYRRVAKIVSTYLESFKKSADKNDKRLRTIWWLTGTITGRASSGGGKAKDAATSGLVNLQNIHGDPQLQNMLISDETWKEIYNAWKEVDGKGDWCNKFLDREVFLAFDHGQLEIRQLAQETGDPELIGIFQRDEDIHSEVGHTLTGWAIEKIKKDKETRKFCKNFHFGLVYGCLDESLVNYLKAKGVNTTLQEVKAKTARYFKRFKNVKVFIAAKRKEAEDTGAVVNVFGFRVPLNMSEDDRDDDEGFWMNQAINFPIQGGAHQLMVIALAILTKKPKTYKMIRTPQMEIHDALVFRIKIRNLVEACALGKQLLERDTLQKIENDFGIKWKVPLKTEPKAGFRFGTLVDFNPAEPVRVFLNRWCEENRKMQIALYKELNAVAA